MKHRTHLATSPRIAEHRLRGLFDEITETTARRLGVQHPTRPGYVTAVLSVFAYRVAEQAANPASFEAIPGDVGLNSEMDRAIWAWAKRAAADLEAVIADSYRACG